MAILRVGSLIDGTPFRVAAKQDTLDCLSRICFRALEPLAGNSILWRSAGEWMEDHCIFREIVAKASAWQKRNSQVLLHRITTEHYRSVGWSITDDLRKYEERVVESFHPNRSSVALRVRQHMKEFLAPPTKKFTTIFKLKRSEGVVVATVLIAYPGDDFGEFCGNVSAREQVVFFNLDHPGSIR